jgi:hypothetical protein
MATSVYDKNDINNILPTDFAFICFASFESRSTVSAQSIKGSRVSSGYCLTDKNMVKSIASEKCILETLIAVKRVSLDLKRPIMVAETLTTIVKDLIEKQEKYLVIDITTFTHEVLLVMLKLLRLNRENFSEIHLLYVGAKEYAQGLNASEKWLSKGCKDVRNVIGYAGLMRPNKMTNLTLLTGFEVERATRLIDIIEPEHLSLGIGVSPTHPNSQTAMDEFRHKFEMWKQNYKNKDNCDVFDFSCKNVQDAISDIEQALTSYPENKYNNIIVPLNTKLSTIAVALFALQHPYIQLGYAVPEAYNTDNYSSAGDNITVVELYKIPQFCQ